MEWSLLYAIDFAAILYFCRSYYKNCYRLGYRIDLWYGFVGLSCVFPCMAMLPLEQSELNALIVGRDFNDVVAAIPSVFMMVILGFYALLIGRTLWRVRLGYGIRETTQRAFSVVPRASMMLMSSRSLLLFLTVICLGVQAVMLAIYFAHDGFGFDLRAYTFANPSIRPVAQVAAIGTVIVASHCFARYIDTRERILLMCTLALTVGLVFFGQRTNLIVIYINIVICYLIKARTRFNLWRMITGTMATVLVFLYLGAARAGVYSPTAFLISLTAELFYGNNFSDLRDFAWIYSHWNHELWLGKTYLAGLATFVPRGLSDFRTTWSFGVATDWTVGLDTELHPGLKPGMFGESFFNFGGPGVVAVGILYGILLRRADLDIKAVFDSPSPTMSRAFASTALLYVASCFCSSLAIPALYAFIGICMLGWGFLSFRRGWRARVSAQSLAMKGYDRATTLKGEPCG